MSTLPSSDKTAKIRALNDSFRKTGNGGKILITQGIQALPVDELFSVLQKVRAFDTFTEDNDPHREHDFGAFDDDGHKVFWKIDYYDLSMEWGSEDPSDPEKTVRVLTIMLASEY
jgi:hypothetical protein